ncbi:hypothetical protein [Pseudomonas asplenii]|uniref:hypothetical protein n=1 Tax=Pseudomonas asplenii TaxID=53407 RepID=UPI00030FE59B|nr:hypothetical protein [Pseudomonas fuscovaginae]
MPSNAAWINVEQQLEDPDSVAASPTAALVALRRSEALMVEGVYRQLLPEHPQVWAYVREGRGRASAGGQ